MPHLLLAGPEIELPATFLESLAGRQWTLHGAPEPGQSYDVVIAASVAAVAEYPDSRVIVVTETPSSEEALAALRAGAYTYFSRLNSESALAEAVLLAPEVADWRAETELLSSTLTWITVRLRCRLQTATLVLHFLREIEADNAARDDIATAVRELVMNAVEHGGHCDASNWIRVSRVLTSHSVLYHIADPGSGFSMHELPHAAISNPPESPVRHVEVRAEHGFRPGGFGLLMIQSLADELVYNQKGNEVLFIKRLENC